MDVYRLSEDRSVESALTHSHYAHEYGGSSSGDECDECQPLLAFQSNEAKRAGDKGA